MSANSNATKILGNLITGTTGTTSTNLVYGTSPTLITPALGTPSALVGTNITGTGASFTAGFATALQNARTIAGVSFDGTANIAIPASGLSNGVTGSGAIVLASSPTLTTAILGSSTATTQTPADNSTKVATTAYVDNAVLGQNFKEAVLVATTANLVGVYLSNVFTYTATGTNAIDGVTLALGNRVLVKNQTTTFQNGWYVVTTAGAIGVAGVLTRSTDANTSGEFKTGDSSFVTSGTANTNTTWAYTGVDSPTLGTDAITYAQTAGQGTVTSGNGITVTGLSVAIDTSVTVDKTTVQTLTNKTLTAPVMTAPVLGTPASGVMTNVTGVPAAAILAGSFGAGAYVISTSLQVATLELGAATDTTLSRVSAGVIAVEGVTVATSSNTLTLTNKTLTNPVLLDGANTWGTFTVPGAGQSRITTNGGNTLDLVGNATEAVRIQDVGDTTKMLVFKVAGATTGTQTNLVASQTATRTLTLPNATDTLVGKATTDTFTNKSMSEAQLTFTDITTGNASTSNHGFLLKLNNSATQFMNGQGAWATPTAATPTSTSNVNTPPASSSTQTITHSLGRTPVKIRVTGYGNMTGSASSMNGGYTTGMLSTSGNTCIYVPAATNGANANRVTSTSFAIGLTALNGGGTNPGLSSGVIGNLTSTTFDIVWTVAADISTLASYLWEAE